MSDDDHLIDNYISVEKVATALGLSNATVRRHCVSGLFPAKKAGRNWLVNKSILSTFQPKAAGQSGYTFASQLNLDVALSRFIARDLEQDMWAPDVLNYADELQDQERIKSIASDKLNGVLNYDPVEIVKVPKSILFNRSASDLSLSDRLAYQAVVQEIARYTEPTMGDRVYAARVADKTHATKKWLKWNNDAREAVGKLDVETGWVITTDITGYFDFIDHVHLKRMLLNADVPRQLVDALMLMLQTWSRSQNRGLPQGPNASRLLANFYLSGIDKEIMRDHDIEYFRYMDDIHIVSQSRSEATKALQHLSDCCYKLGLPLSSNKTASVSAVDAYISLAGDVELRGFEYEIFLSDGVDEAIASDLAALFTKSTESDTVNIRQAKFSLYRLLRDGYDDALAVVLDKLQNLGSLEVLVPRYVGRWADRPIVADAIGKYLNDADLNVSDYLASWLLAIFLKDDASVTDSVVDYARKVSYDANTTRYLRCVAINVLARFGDSSDIDRIKRMATDEYDPKIGRAAIVALARANKLDKSLTLTLSRRNNYLHTMAYLKGRQGLPSPIKE